MSDKQSFAMDRHVELMEYAAKLEAVLRDARSAIASLPEDALGEVQVWDVYGQHHAWPAKAELMSKIDAALSKV